MRNPNRIDEMLKEIENVWKANPDLRFAQLVLNVTDFYYMEDDKFMERFRQIYGKTD